MTIATFNRKVDRDEKRGVWIIDGERYVAASICGAAFMLPLGRPVVIEEQANPALPSLRARSLLPSRAPGPLGA